MPAVQIAEPAEPVPIDSDLLCGGCRQNLRGVAADRCPECGRRFDRSRVISHQLSWEIRRGFGRIPAFFSTVWLVTRRPSRLLEPAAITLAQARGFRLAVVLLLYICFCALTITWFYNQDVHPSVSDLGKAIYDHDVPDPSVLIRTPWFFYPSLVAALPALLCLTGIGQLFFRSRYLDEATRRQAVAVSLYTNGILVWSIPLMGLLFFIRAARNPNTITTFSTWLDTSYFAAICLYAGVGLGVLWLLVLSFVPCRMLLLLTGSRNRRLAFAMLALPLAAICSAIIFVTIHAVVLLAMLLKSQW